MNEYINTNIENEREHIIYCSSQFFHGNDSEPFHHTSLLNRINFLRCLLGKIKIHSTHRTESQVTANEKCASEPA